MVQDTAAGSSVSIAVVQNKTGAAPPALPDTLTLSLLIDDTQTAITTFAVTPNDTNGNSQSFSFFFTSTGLTGGAARAGTVKIKLTAVNTSGVSAQNYAVNTDNSPGDTFGTGNTNTVGTRDKGWIRGTTTSTSTLSNVALGGAKNSPAQYPESLFVRSTLGAALYTARALTVAMSGTTPALSGATNSATSGNYDVSFASVVDNRYAAASTTTTTSLSVPNATLTGIADFTLTATNDSMTVDPRLTCTHLLQANSSSFATPPLSSTARVTSGQRLTTDLDFLTTNIRSARGTQVANATTGGINALAVTQSLADANGLTSALTNTATTATKGAETGWADTFLAWSATLPGGNWNKTVTVNSPAAIVGATYLLNSAITYALLAPDPAVQGLPGLMQLTDTHWSPGVALTVALGAFSGTAQSTVTVSSPTITVLRANPVTQRYEYLRDSDFTWQPLTGGTATPFTPTVSGSDANLFSITFTAAQTAGWASYNLIVSARFVVSGTPYNERLSIPAVSSNSHSGGGAAVTPADIIAIANAVWDELTAEARAAGSYGELVRNRIDVAVSSRAPGTDTTTLLARLTAGRAALLDNLDVAVSTRAQPGQITTRERSQVDIS